MVLIVSPHISIAVTLSYSEAFYISAYKSVRCITHPQLGKNMSIWTPFTVDCKSAASSLLAFFRLQFSHSVTSASVQQVKYQGVLLHVEHQSAAHV